MSDLSVSARVLSHCHSVRVSPAGFCNGYCSDIQLKRRIIKINLSLLIVPWPTESPQKNSLRSSLKLLYLSGAIFRSQDSALSSSLHKAVSSINNSSLILPDTRLDLHTLYTEGDFVSSYEAVCSQLQHSVLAIFSGLQESSVNHHSLHSPRSQISSHLIDCNSS